MFSLIFVVCMGQQGNKKKLALVEEFVNVSCVPCVKEVQSFDELVKKDGNVILLKYHLGVPGEDLFYSSNSDEIDIRDKFYNVTHLPSIYLNGEIVEGKYYPGAPANLTSDQILQETVKKNDFPFELSYAFDEGCENVSISIKPGFEFESYGKRIFVAIAEREVSFYSPPGNNGQKNFEHVFRKFVTDAQGLPFDDLEKMLDNDGVAQWNIPIPHVYDLKNLEVVAFIVQDEIGEVLSVQNAYTHDIVFNPDKELDLSATIGSFNNDMCLSERELVYRFSNRGEVPITNFTYEVTYKNNKELFEVDDVNILKGGVYPVTATIIDLEQGNNKVKIEVKAVNNFVNGDHYNLNNTDENIFEYFKPESELLDEGFESYEYENEGLFTDISGYDLAISKVSANDFGRDNIKVGGYANSESSVLIDFYTWDPEKYNVNSKFAQMTYGEMNISSIPNPHLVFDYTSASNAYDEDRMYVIISKNCGETYNTLKIYEGDELRTASSRSGFYIPTQRNEWQTARVSLEDYKDDDIILGFKFESGFGNNLYIDNIRISDMKTTSTEEVDNNDFSFYPNPVGENINIDILDHGNIIIRNALGELVKNQEVEKGEFSIDISDFKPGIYIVQFNTRNEITSKTFIKL